MSASLVNVWFKTQNVKTRHRFWIRLCILCAAVLVAALVWYGLDYYTLGQALRPLSPKHRHLKPGGILGIRLGILGVGLFLILFLYPIRKRWKWLSRIGKSKHWLDFHIVTGLMAPVIITFHSSFKFQGIAGLAYWIMLAVVISGIVGRYLYAQIPRSLSAVELSLRQAEELRARLSQQLENQQLISPIQLSTLFSFPGVAEVRKMPLTEVLRRIILLDAKRPFQVWSLRTRLNHAGRHLSKGSADFRDYQDQVEKAIDTLRRQATLSKKVVFYSQARRIFHLWHVIHRPFSYSFVVLVLAHIAVVLSLGYF